MLDFHKIYLQKPSQNQWDPINPINNASYLYFFQCRLDQKLFQVKYYIRVIMHFIKLPLVTQKKARSMTQKEDYRQRFQHFGSSRAVKQSKLQLVQNCEYKQNSLCIVLAYCVVYKILHTIFIYALVFLFQKPLYSKNNQIFHLISAMRNIFSPVMYEFS